MQYRARWVKPICVYCSPIPFVLVTGIATVPSVRRSQYDRLSQQQLSLSDRYLLYDRYVCQYVFVLLLVSFGKGLPNWR